MEDSVKNPWLEIPFDDYEGHMRDPAVGQFAFLSQIFYSQLNRFSPDSVGILGAATGNGLEHIDRGQTRSVTVFDINPHYLEVLEQRYRDRIPGLEIRNVDLNLYDNPNHRFAMIYAALVFEYVDCDSLLERSSKWLKQQGVLTVILQQADAANKKVSRTRFASLEKLAPLMNLVYPETFRDMAAKHNLVEIFSETVRLPAGKTFHVASYRKNKG